MKTCPEIAATVNCPYDRVSTLFVKFSALLVRDHHKVKKKKKSFG